MTTNRPLTDVFDRLDPAVQRAVQVAERLDGYKYGPAIYIGPDGRGQSAFVAVTFYPKRQWWVIIADSLRLKIEAALKEGGIEEFR